MPFTVGHKLSPGRQKGSVNIKGEYWDSFKTYILSTGLRNLEADMASLSPKDRVYAIISMMEYFKPKLSRNQNVNEIEKETLDKLTQLYKDLADAKSRSNEENMSSELQRLVGTTDSFN